MNKKMFMFRTIPQQRFWANLLGIETVVDYTSAIAASTSQTMKVTTTRLTDPVREWALAKMTKVVLPETENLADNRRSLQERYETSIQDRRQGLNTLPRLSLPSMVIAPEEAAGWQYAVSVFLPVFKKIPVKAAHTAVLYRHQLQPASYCAGCAHWWNYHSSLPGEYHKLYSGTISDLSSALVDHLSNCIYAQLFFWKLSTLTAVQKHKAVTGFNSKMIRIDRSGSSDLSVRSNLFEYFSHEGDDIVKEFKRRAARFTKPTTWPVLAPSGYVDEEIKVKSVSKFVLDTYGDMLFSTDEAISQANWAIARPFGPTDMFNGPTKLVLDKQHREKRRIEKQIRAGCPVSRRGVWGGPISWDHFS
jgi:hypothetical protein